MNRNEAALKAAMILALRLETLTRTLIRKGLVSPRELTGNRRINQIQMHKAIRRYFPDVADELESAAASRKSKRPSGISN